MEDRVADLQDAVQGANGRVFAEHGDLTAGPKSGASDESRPETRRMLDIRR